MKIRSQLLFILILFFLKDNLLTGQPWQFAKEEAGIRIYTRKESGRSIKSYKGEATVKAPAAKVVAMLEDIHHTDWWDKNVKMVRIISYEKNRSAKYYIEYDLPWPVADRDLAVEVRVEHDIKSETTKIIAGPLNGVVPEKPDKVRIKAYAQSWTVKAAGPGMCLVVLEGFADPAGNVPDWLINYIIVDSPLKLIREVRSRMEAKQQ
jgi:hypothetical protein